MVLDILTGSDSIVTRKQQFIKNTFTQKVQYIILKRISPKIALPPILLENSFYVKQDCRILTRGRNKRLEVML